jgi:hypothetical protein
VEAVEIETVEAGPFSVRGQRVVVRSQPLDELHHLDVAPHPPGETPEIGERFGGIEIVAGTADIAVDPVGVGPVRLDRDGREPLLVDQPLGDPGSLAIELVGAVGRLAEQHKARVADQVHQRIIIPVGAGQSMGGLAYRLARRAVDVPRGRLRFREMLTPRQQLADLSIRRLSEVLVPVADSVKGFRCDRADDLVDLCFQLAASLGRGGRYRNDDLGRPVLPQCLDGCAHCSVGCQTVIDQDQVRPCTSRGGRPPR